MIFGAPSASSASHHGVRLEIETPEGAYAIEADHVAACDGSRSPMRRAMPAHL